jgi:glycosyltransferase involved in cell wall biosynthesis
LLVPLEDAGALADAIDQLAANPQLRRQFGKASRELVERTFSSERIGSDLVALYQRLLEQPA